MPLLTDKVYNGKRKRRVVEWHSWEIDLLNYWKQEGLKNEEIALRFGVSYKAVIWELNKRGLRKFLDWKKEKVQVENLIKQGYAVFEIADLLDLESRSVWNRIKTYNLPLPSEIKKQTQGDSDG